MRARLLRLCHDLYKTRLNRTGPGRWIARQIRERGLVTQSEMQALGRAEDRVLSAAASVEADYSVPGFHYSQPLNLELADALTAAPRINLLLPSLRLKHMSGGPNTALVLAALLAEQGELVRVIAGDADARGEAAAVFPHIDNLLGRPCARERIELVDAFDRRKPIQIGVNDVFMATAWWTAQMAKYAVRKTACKSFIYLIQDFEPVLHEGSTFQARALETYGLAHIPVINTRLLRDHLAREQAGLYADPDFAAAALCFEPALSRADYFPEVSAKGKKTLLFYARPNIAPRNLFEIGMVALRQAVASGGIAKDEWNVWAMGEKLPPAALGNGVMLRPLPWMGFQDYAKRVRTADVMLSLMLSPHPSYPPLEMAACGRLAVTNSFSVKTAAAMRGLSPNIIAAAPNAEDIAAALAAACGRVNAGLGGYDPTGAIDLPGSWDESLSKIVPELLRRVAALRAAPGGVAPGLPVAPQTAYEEQRLAALARRRAAGGYRQEPGLLSFITTVYDTAPDYLQALASCMFRQDGEQNFEWLILDNGSSNPATLQALREIGAHAGVRLERVERNLGIVGGMRFCLERATGRYVLPLDSDDLIEPDCVNMLTQFIQAQKYPVVLYSDEDKVQDGRFSGAYFKPGWDPVLFLHSCYIAHLCAIDRALALELGLYSDASAEGCHDWDSFIRFMNAGHVPAHLPEVLYSWRIHPGSTSGNIASKSFITESHRATLGRALAARDGARLELVASPLFETNVDWWFRRKRDAAVDLVSVILSGDDLRPLERTLAESTAALVHVTLPGVTPDDDEWRWDAAGLLEFFDDAMMVGGMLHDGVKLVDGPRVFGFGNGCDCPDRGRKLADPGYFAAMWKPRSVAAVPSGHCVLRRDFLLQILPVLLAENVAPAMLGPWAGALAAEAGKRVIFSPFLRARAAAMPVDDTAKFLSRFWVQLPDTRYYAARLGLTAQSAYTPVPASARLRHLQELQQKTLDYRDWLEMRLRLRGGQYSGGEAISVCLLTTIYEHTNFAYLAELADSVVKQTLRAAQWVIVAHGPIPADVLGQVKAHAAGWGATLVVEAKPLGIMGAMHLALTQAETKYIVPVDADDLLTADALQILTSEIARLGEPDMVFSDEDLLVDGVPASPYLRGGFDPVLNLDSSTIWHLCAIKRERALALALYTDAAATWCHDWDSVLRIAQAGGRVEHIPEILYHWRQHGGSTTNKTEGDPRSLESVRHVLERKIAGLQQPERFYVAPWPVDRGAKELFIARHNVEMPRFGRAGDEGEADMLIFTANDVVVDSEQSFLEVARLMELHPHIGAVGGLVTDDLGTVVDACGMANGAGVLESPWLGRAAGYGGPYALAGKTQMVSVTGSRLAFFRTAALRDAGGWELGAAPADIIARLAARGWGVAFSPLVRGRSGVAQAGITWPTTLPACENALLRYGMSRNFKE